MENVNKQNECKSFAIIVNKYTFSFCITKTIYKMQNKTDTLSFFRLYGYDFILAIKINSK